MKCSYHPAHWHEDTRSRVRHDAVLGNAGLLTVKHLEQSTMIDVLGFAVDRRHEREGKLIAVTLRAGAVRILLTQDDGAKGLDRAKGEGLSLQITTSQSVDAVAAEIRKHGGILDTEPTSAPWESESSGSGIPTDFVSRCRRPCANGKKSTHETRAGRYLYAT